MPPWSPIFGHLLSLPPVLKLFPKDAISTLAFGELSKKFPESDGLYYLDAWPIGIPLLVITSPSQAIQACQQYDLPKPDVLDEFFHPFAGGDNLFTMNGSEWKRSRAMFNPGFNANYLLGHISHIVEEASVYVEVLREHAQRGQMFSLDEITLWFTMDIIGAVTLNARLHSQRMYNPLASAMRSQVLWQCLNDEFNPLVRWNPFRPMMQWYNGRRMDKYISDELDNRFAERQGTTKDPASRSIIDLALDSYIADHPLIEASHEMDKSFKAWAITQIRLFIFAGHDSTSATICFCYYFLSQDSEASARIRAEHEAVFGTDLSRVTALLVEQPHLINQLPYTTAVIKEAMRLSPPASGMRGGLPGVDIEDSNGNRYPTAGMNIWVLHDALHRHPQHWKDPNKFVPERWLVGPENPYYPVKGAWRPFEFGRRNCVGQTLVMLDVKTVLVMTLREFDIRPAYEEWDKLHPSKGMKIVAAERAYLVSHGGAHPADGYPCRVTVRKS
ncbi:hypothetical protein MMC18_007601 [Xylographa bjoerkii]|nr:hypothetical protein [Xylographa bjoerkii]